MQKPLYGKYKIQIEHFTVPQPLKHNFGKQFMTNKIITMTQKQKLEDATGVKMPEPTEQEQKRIQLQNSPFWIIGNDQKGYNIIMGKWKLNKEPLDFKQELQENDEIPLNDYELQLITKAWLKDNEYNIMLSIIIAVTTDILNQKQHN